LYESVNLVHLYFSAKSTRGTRQGACPPFFLAWIWNQPGRSLRQKIAIQPEILRKLRLSWLIYNQISEHDFFLLVISWWPWRKVPFFW
jgi:hypothetical protein